ncbi:uncharacterized protein BYT42DRAFT_169396 [Radiomyces spectabilis]|uniref:uncharacterized protein n=1 Tax=Radiomyces spectabilis TaxID=64574 RepID=UPI0022210497|nr:uncharacterized protein BYT42DRAFT_169396 [Radiomyces spectabilis]KAI8364775.1 hypothetical protein BYT42DRAFT_169396 [Radiomyces spectabilis]
MLSSLILWKFMAKKKKRRYTSRTTRYEELNAIPTSFPPPVATRHENCQTKCRCDNYEFQIINAGRFPCHVRLRGTRMCQQGASIGIGTTDMIKRHGGTSVSLQTGSSKLVNFNRSIICPPPMILSLPFLWPIHPSPQMAPLHGFHLADVDQGRTPQGKTFIVIAESVLKMVIKLHWTSL